MAERKFTRGLCKPGMAAQVRENVSQAVKATATQVKPRLADPIDFEDYVSKNKIMLNNDTLRELLLYPPDDMSHCVVPRVTRTLQSLASVHLQEDITNPLVRQCLATYSQDLTTITYKYLPYSGSYLHLPRLPRVDDLKEQVYEVDTDIEQGDLAILMNGENILKKGYLLKGPESGNDKIFGNFSSKTFKRRFACLRQEVDGTYLLEFHKDERKHDPKGTIVMDFCTQITRNPKRGKCCFELQLSECAKSVMLSAESEADLEDWIDKLTRVIHADKPQDDSRSERGITPPSSNYGTLRGLEHSLNPQLIKYAHETDYSIAQARREDRHQLFTCYSNLPLEPYITHAALYDVSRSCKLSEDFHFDMNNPMARNLLSRNKKKSDDMKENSGISLPLSLSGIPEEWIAHPKQAVMSVTRPNSEVFLVIWIEKVLQGSISQTVEPYLKSMDLKSIQKLQRTIKTCCHRTQQCT